MNRLLSTWIVLISVLCWSCAGSSVSAFAKDRAAAERAYAAGRYREAARHWEAAAGHAKSAGWARKAQHRQAMSLLRGGDWQAAGIVLKRLASKPSPLASRASYDLALLELEHGQRAQGIARLQRLLTGEPESGVASIALRRYLQQIEEDRGSAQLLLEMDRMLSLLGNTALDESLRFERARELERAGQWESALAAYLDLAERHPYPVGAHWDDALWYAADLERRLGRPKASITHLERMLRARESSDFVGSYERPRYGEARFRLAELIRDELHDPARARDEFWRVFKGHPNSRLRDDALWEAAKIASAQGDSAGACSLLRTLRRDLRESRYVACASLLCAELASTPNDGARPYCAPYIASSLATRPTP